MTEAERVAALRRFIEQNEPDDPGRDWYPSQGWAIFDVGDGNYEAQCIDELAVAFRMTDEKARRAAMAFGYKFDDKKRPYLVTGWPEGAQQ